MNKQDILNILDEKLKGVVIDKYSYVRDFERVLREIIDEEIKKAGIKENYCLGFYHRDHRENHIEVVFYKHDSNFYRTHTNKYLLGIDFHKKDTGRKYYQKEYCYKDFEVTIYSNDYNKDITIKDRIKELIESDSKELLKEQNEFNESVDDMKKIVDVLNVGFDECITKLEKIIKLKYKDSFKKNVEGKNV